VLSNAILRAVEAVETGHGNGGREEDGNSGRGASEHRRGNRQD
jgi:hypothetical protein